MAKVWGGEPNSILNACIYILTSNRSLSLGILYFTASYRAIHVLRIIYWGKLNMTKEMTRRFEPLGKGGGGSKYCILVKRNVWMAPKVNTKFKHFGQISE